MEEEVISQRTQFILFLLIAAFYFLGVYGFFIEGERIINSLFYAIQLITLNYGDEPPNICIEIARWGAPLLTWGAVLLAIKPFARWLVDSLTFLFARTIIYSDTENGRTLYEDIKNNNVFFERAIIAADKEAIRHNAKTSVIMMDSDRDALEIYDRINKDHTIHLCLNSMEPNLIPSSRDTDIMNSNDIIAGCFWKKHLNLTARYIADPAMCYKVIIIGFGDLGKRILYKGLLLNLFTLKQKIEYCVCDSADEMGSWDSSVIRNLMNNDEVVVIDGYPDDDTLSDADAIVVTSDGMGVDYVQQLLYRTQKAHIYYYDPTGAYFEEMLPNVEYEYERLHGFGHHYTVKDNYKKLVFSQGMVLRNSLLRKAKELNLSYNKGADPKSIDELWNKLDGFTKGSNINAMDYAETGRAMLGENPTEEKREEMAELEHIRWCRYHFLNHWTHGEIKGDNRKDRHLRIHSDLMPYLKLKPEEKEKDKEVVYKWKEN